MLKRIPFLGSLVFALALGSIATVANARPYDERCGNCGVVRSVEEHSHKDKHLGGGTVVGALVGGALGSTVGKGDGRTAATVGGAVVGGAVGHSVEKKNRDHYVVYHFAVEMDDGRVFTSEQGDSFGLRPGDRVAVDDGYVHPLYR